MNPKNIPVIIVIIAALALLAASPSWGGEAEIKEVSANKDALTQYELFEISISLPSQYANPYNYEEVDLTANVTTPDGGTLVIPSFYTGQNSIWKARYTPTKTGRYSYYISLKSAARIYNSDVRHFEVSPGKGHGFLRKSANNPFYLVFDSGRPFFGIGHNIGWLTNNNIPAYERYFLNLSQNGCNLARIWVNAPWTFSIEDKNVCSYNTEDPAKLDSLIELAKEYGIYLILSLDTYGALMEERGSWNEQFWRTNPYNKANGGPCEEPWDFFTNKDAKKYYKNRLRYIVARWGYSPNILAFELWNEVDAPPEWVKEMSSYIKLINPHGQLITTSLGYPWGNNFNEGSVWSLPEIDIIERHLYGNMTKDVIENLITINREFSQKYSKPVLVGEFGMDASRNDADIDMVGSAAAMHSSLWASMLTKSFATSLNWWWVEYIKGKNLYHHYKAIKNFTDGIDWNSPRIDFLKTGLVKMSQSEGQSTNADVSIATNDAWGDTSYKEFSVLNNGDTSGGLVNRFLHGTQKKEFRLEPIFHVDYPSDGKFIVHVDMVSQGANLVISIDGREVFTKDLPAGPGEGPWKRSLYRPDYKIYQCVYDAPFEIDVPKGKHTIHLSNSGKDWLSIKRIILTNYRSDTFANARALGLRVGGEMLFWIQNKEYNWKDLKRLAEPRTIHGGSFSAMGIEDGRYDVEWWDTFEGKVLSRAKAIAKNNELILNLPDFSKDIACKVRKETPR